MGIAWHSNESGGNDVKLSTAVTCHCLATGVIGTLHMQGVSSVPTLCILLDVLALVQVHYDPIAVIFLSYLVDLMGQVGWLLLQHWWWHGLLFCVAAALFCMAMALFFIAMALFFVATALFLWLAAFFFVAVASFFMAAALTLFLLPQHWHFFVARALFLVAL